MSDGMIEIEGTIDRIFGNNQYQVVGEHEGRHLELLCHLSGKMRRHKINVLVGDKVRVEVPPPYDKGRITFREK